MIFVLSPIIVFVLYIRFYYFRGFTKEMLPLLDDNDRKRMVALSRNALNVSILALVLSIVLAAVPSILKDAGAAAVIPRGVVQWGSLALTIAGLAIAATLDLKADKIRRRGLGAKPTADSIRWYHIFFSVLIPYVALPWGLVNLVRHRKKSGLTMLLTSLAVFVVVVVIVLLVEKK